MATSQVPTKRDCQYRPAWSFSTRERFVCDSHCKVPLDAWLTLANHLWIILRFLIHFQRSMPKCSKNASSRSDHRASNSILAHQETDLVVIGLLIALQPLADMLVTHRLWGLSRYGVALSQQLVSGFKWKVFTEKSFPLGNLKTFLKKEV